MKIDKVILSLGTILFLSVAAWVSSCTHKADLGEIDEVCFERDVLPIFQNNCAMTGCHNGSGESSLVLTTFVPISHAVDPGSPSSSAIYKAITATWGENRMPPGQPLSLDNRTIIRLWIEQGARLTICSDTTVPPGQPSGFVNPLACFSRDILPVLTSKCGTAGCHDQITHKEGYVFTSYSTTMTAVSAGNPGNSKLYEVIKLASGEEKMPPAGKTQLTTAEVDSIRNWISYGALNEYCGETCDTINTVTFSGTIWPVVQSSCTGCHSGASPLGGVALESYANVAALAANGLLMNSLKGAGVTKMPMGGSFTTCRIRQFELWVNNGYLNN
jgi:hypothetical protein